MSTAQSDGGNLLGEIPSDKPEFYQVESWCLLASLLKCPTFSGVSHVHQTSRNISFCCETLVRLRHLGTGALLLKMLWGKTYNEVILLGWPDSLVGLTGFSGQPFRRCSSFLLIPVINSMTKCNLGSEGFDWTTQPHHSPSFREVSAGTQARAKAWNTEQCCLLDCPSWLSLLAFLYDHSGLLRSCTTHSGLGLFTSLINQESAP